MTEKADESMAAGDQNEMPLQGFGFDLPEDAWMRQLRSDLRRRLPEHIGRYRVLRELDRGGQAVLLLGRDEDAGTPVALKRLRSGTLATVTERARFQRELEVTAGLVHPGIVRVLGVEALDDEPIICLEWIEGRPVDAWAAGQRDHPEFPGPILDVFLQICAAVGYAHQKGVLHRDLKPSNVLVDGRGHAVVLDFGVAGFLAEQGQGLTRTAEFVGTPVYAAPERLGVAAVPDTRGDVYSLGVLLYEVLVGHLPWETSGRLADTLRRIRTEDPAPLDRHDRWLGPDLDAIIRMALARSPDERYQSVDALADDVVRYLAGQPVAASQSGRNLAACDVVCATAPSPARSRGAVDPVGLGVRRDLQ